MSETYSGDPIPRDMTLEEILRGIETEIDRIKTADSFLRGFPDATGIRRRRAEALGRLRIYALKLVDYEAEAGGEGEGVST